MALQTATSGQTGGLWRPLLTEYGISVSLAPLLPGRVQHSDLMFNAPHPGTLAVPFLSWRIKTQCETETLNSELDKPGMWWAGRLNI